MKRWRSIHLYLGCVFAPTLVLFCVTGSAQLFGVQFGVLSEVHTKGLGSLPFMILAGLMGLSVAVTSLVGVRLAFQSSARRRDVWACLLFGLVVPLVLLATAYWKQLR